MNLTEHSVLGLQLGGQGYVGHGESRLVLDRTSPLDQHRLSAKQ